MNTGDRVEIITDNPYYCVTTGRVPCKGSLKKGMRGTVSKDDWTFYDLSVLFDGDGFSRIINRACVAPVQVFHYTCGTEIREGDVVKSARSGYFPKNHPLATVTHIGVDGMGTGPGEYIGLDIPCAQPCYTAHVKHVVFLHRKKEKEMVKANNKVTVVKKQTETALKVGQCFEDSKDGEPFILATCTDCSGSISYYAAISLKNGNHWNGAHRTMQAAVGGLKRLHGEITIKTDD